MKKTYLISLSIIFVVILLVTCTKTDREPKKIVKSQAEMIFSSEDYRDPLVISNHLDNYHSALNSKAPAWWKKFKKWVKAHTGTHLFQNCQGEHECGPCPGMCLSIDNIPIMVAEDYELTSSDSANGYSLFILHENEDSLMVISFIDSSYFVHNGYFYLHEDWDLGSIVADTFDQPEIVIQSGVYPVVTSYHPQGETVVDIDN